MGRTVAVVWHVSCAVAAGVLYFFFVLPRTFELLGDTSHTLGTALRIVTGALIGLAALPVVFTLQRTRRPEFGVPHAALRLRTASIVLHVLAAALIIGTAIAEIWISLDSAGQWLFGVYGAAAAIALLGFLAFHLAFVAELPPPPPKPVKIKQRTSRRRGKSEHADSADTADTAETVEDTEAADVDEAASEPEPTSDTESEPDTDSDTEAPGKLQNKRPTGKGTLLSKRRRTRGSVAVED
ncbi:membrane protein [Mycobacterium sp. SWH-M1]|nr:membrane protein [Mycobacterium sp. SWH-M1]